MILIITGILCVGILLPLLSDSVKFSWVDLGAILVLLTLPMIHFFFIRRKRQSGKDA